MKLLFALLLFSNVLLAAPRIVVCDGDSRSFVSVVRTSDFGALPLNVEYRAPWPSIMQTNMGSNYTVLNYAQNGQTLLGISNHLASSILQWRTNSAGEHSIFILWAGLNSYGQFGLTNGSDRTNAFLATSNICASARSAGFFVVVATDYVSFIQDLCDMVRESWTGYADALADLNLQSLRDDSYYYSDGIHIADAGEAIVAALMQEAANAVLATRLRANRANVGRILKP